MDADAQSDILSLKWAYHVLGVDHNVTALVIKQRYRALIKEWHPDKWVGDPDKEASATKKMQEINNAYGQIKDAPLRYHISTHPKVQERWEKRTQQAEYNPVQREYVRQNILEKARKRRRAEYTARFLIGMFISIFPLIFLHLVWEDVFPDTDRMVFVLTCIIFPLYCGWGNARYRDDFWSGAGEVFSWWWWLR